MSYEFPGAYAGQKVRLTFDAAEFAIPGYVLVFAFDEGGRLLLTRNKKRGWEVPGGTREAGEWPIQTAIREVYEETGAELRAIEAIAQYAVEMPGSAAMVKTIYVAQIEHLHPLPEGFETSERRLFDEPPAPLEVREDETFSPIMKDDVYRLALERALQHRYAGRERV